MRKIATLVLLSACSTALAVDHAVITVDSSGVASKIGGTADFSLDTGKVTGEIPIRIGASASDDAANGVLINAVSELDRNGIYTTGSTVRDSSSNSTNSRGTSGALSITSTKAGPASPADAGTLVDANLSAAYFPFAAGWQGGSLYSSTVNNNGSFGALDTLIASGGIGLPSIQQNVLGTDGQPQPGVHKVTIPGVTDTNRQGVLLTNTASNVGRFTTVAPSLDGDGYIVRSVDNDGYFEFDPGSDPSTGGEGDAVDTPFSYVFVPVDTPGVTLARVATNGGSTVQGEQIGVPLVHSGADFSVTSNNLVAPGSFRLEIDGVTPADGTLIVTPVGATEDLGGRAADNVLTYEADSTGWNILSQDIEADFLYGIEGQDLRPLDGTGQAANGSDPYFNFVFIPNQGAPTAPAATPAPETLTNFSRSRVIGWNTEVTGLSPENGNNPGDNLAVVGGNGTEQTSDVRIDMFANRGDISVAVDGAYLNTRDGLLFTTVNEGFRNNTDTGGQQEYGLSMTTAFDAEWSVVTASAANISGSDEHNLNFASAFFGADSGFDMGINVDLPGAFGDPYDSAKVDVDLAGVNSQTDGVMFAIGFGNDDNWASATPKNDGSGWELRTFDNNYDSADPDGRTEPDAISWLYLPYESQNLTAGLVDSNGSVVSSSPGLGEDWTLTKEADSFGFAQYRLSFSDSSKNPGNGMLLLTGTGDFDSTGTENTDNSMLYVADGEDFLIRGIDHVLDDGSFTDFQDTGFMFAYIDFNNAPIAPATELLPGDYNGDGMVDAEDYNVWRDNLGASALPNNETGSIGVVDEEDYLVWKSNFGATAGQGSLSESNVPEPASLLLLGIVAGGLFAANRYAPQSQAK